MADDPQPLSSTSIEERKLILEAQRIAIDHQRANTEASFFHKNSVALLSAAISLAAVVVSVAQVVNTSVQENIKLQQSTQLEREKLRLSAIDGDQRARIEIAKFVTENQNKIFAGTLTERAAMKEFMRQIFPEGLIVSALNAAEPHVAKSDASRPRPGASANPKPPLNTSSSQPSSQSAAAVSYDLAGKWLCTKYCPAGGEGKDARIDQDGLALVFTNEGGGVSRGYFLEGQIGVIATDWNRLIGLIKDKGARIEWLNGTDWVRKQR